MKKEYPDSWELKITVINPKLRRLEEAVSLQSQIVPSGFVWDGATVPRMFWWLLSPHTHAIRASLVHDYICMVSVTSKQRRLGDRKFRKQLKDDGVWFAPRWIAYLAVRVYSEWRMFWYPRKTLSYWSK